MTKKNLLSLIKDMENNFYETRELLTKEMFKDINTYCKFKFDGLTGIQNKYFGTSISINKFKKETLNAYLNEIQSYITNYYIELRACTK